jgi:hypothetical protein
MSLIANNIVVVPAPPKETMGGVTASKIVILGKPEEVVPQTAGAISAGNIVIQNKPKSSYAMLRDPRVLQKKTPNKAKRVSNFMHDMTTVHKI